MPSNQGLKGIIIAKNQEKANLLGIIIVSACFLLCRSRHNRKTFGSVLARNGISTAVTTDNSCLLTLGPQFGNITTC
jgi:hypothetical protein